MTDTAITPTTPDIGALMSQAMEKGPEGVAMLERLEAMYERQLQRDRDAERKRAITAALHEIPTIITSDERKQSRVTRDGRVANGYAKLGRIQSIVDPIMARHGLAYRWDRKIEGERVWVVFIVEHENGTEEERSRMLDAVDEAAMNKQGKPIRPALQDVGSGDSYISRYTLCRGLKIRLADDGDDDGASSGGVEVITDEQHAVLTDMAGELPDEDVETMMNWLKAKGIGSLAELPAPMFDNVKAGFKRALEKRGNA